MILDSLFAAAYDPFMARVERTGLGAWRTELLGALSGKVLEIGAGTGASLAHYPDDLRVTLLEPVEPMRRRLEAKAGDHTVVEGAAEALPFADGSFDAVVSCLVLCSVDDLHGSLAEIYRVLKPGGRLFYIEHVASPHPATARAQRMLEPAWKVLARGCHLCRDTEAAILQAGFVHEAVDRSNLPGGAWVVNAAVHGIATKPGPSH